MAKTKRKPVDHTINNPEGVYLIVADDTEEFKAALQFAARVAQANLGHIAILYVIEEQDFQHWGNIEERIRAEKRQEAEKKIWAFAKKINEISGVVPSLYIEEGDRKEIIIDLINRDLNIKRIILGGGVGTAGPGPLVSYFCSKDFSRLRVPLIVVPGNLEPHEVDAII